MARQTRTLSLPWIPVGLSSLVLLALVVVLSAPGAVRKKATATTVVNHTVTSIVTKYQVETKTVFRTPGGTAHVTTTTNRSWPTVGPTPDAPLPGEINPDWNLDSPPVSAGFNYTVQMNPMGHFTLWCNEFHYDVTSPFFVPVEATDCRLDITGVTGTSWTLRVIS